MAGSGSVGTMSDTAAARELLRDSFTRLIEHVDEVTDGLTEDVSCWRPTPEANSIAWLLWHSARCQDMQLCDIAGVDQVWTSEGWEQRFALDLPHSAAPATTSGTVTRPKTSARYDRRSTCWSATTARCTR